MPDKLKSLLVSRRFWAAVGGVASVFAAEYFNIELDVEQLVAIATMISAWIVGDTVRPTE